MCHEHKIFDLLNVKHDNITLCDILLNNFSPPTVKSLNGTRKIFDLKDFSCEVVFLKQYLRYNSLITNMKLK